MESSSEVGLSEQPKSPKPTTEEFQSQFKQAMDKQKSIPKDLSGKPIFDTQKIEETKTIFKNIEKERKQLTSEKKKYGDVFDKQLNIKPKVEESQYLKDRLSSINTDLINREEEYVVPELEYQFGDLGFKFEESGATGDFVKVTAPNGKTTEISLDNFLDSKSKAQSQILQKFIKDNTPAKGLFVLENSMREQDKKFNSQKQVDDSIKVISTELNNLNAKQKQFLAKKSQFDKELKALGANPDKEALSVLEQQRLALKAEMDALIKEEENIKQKSKKLDSAVGKYSIAKSKQGTWGGGIWNAINEGASSMSAGITNLTIDLTTEIAPAGFGMSPKDLKDISVDIAKKIGVKGPNANQTIEQWKKTLTEDQLDNWEDEVDDYIKKDLKGNLLPAIRIGNREVFGDADTTKQWSNLKEQDFWGGAILGVAKSLPAMIGGAGPVGAAQRTAQMYAQVSDGLTQEMEQDPDFKDISENEKLAITLPIGIVGAVLENIGLKNIKGSQGVINRIALNALGKSGRGVTAKTFRELVENEVDGMLSKGLLTITAAGAAEFETGAAQELSDTAFKAVYNEIKGKEMFDTPESAADLIENIAVAGAQEAVGGFVLGVPTAVSTAFTQKGFLKMDDATFDTFANMANDEKMQSAYIATLKDKITRGELTTAEAKDQLNNYRNSVGLFRQLPDGIDTQGKKEAMNLLKEKRDLENYINEKDPALVVKQKNRIAEINDSLTKLSETNAIQEQSTTEVPVQSETGISETVAEGISEPKPEVVTKQATQEVVKEPTIVVHGAVNGFGLQYSEGINAEDIVTPKDGRGFLPVEQQKDLNEYKSVIAEDTVSDDGNKLLTIITPSSDNFGRSATNTFEFIIPNGNTSTSEGIKAILDEVTKSDLKGKEVINESVNQVKEYINSNKPVTETQPEVNAVESLLTPEVTEQITQPEVTQPQTIIEEQTAEEEISRLFNDENRFQADYAENKVDYFETEEATKEGFKKYSNYLNLMDPLKEYFKGGGVISNGVKSMYLDAEKTNIISLDEIAELYHKAKADNSNPELVQAVEKGLTSISNIEENAYRNNEYLNKIKQEVSSKTQPTTETETQDETGKQSTVQSERTGDGRTRRAPISKTTPLEGTPKVEGATGPDQQLVSVAEKYAAENGIDLKRQGEYVEVNEERAKRIADAYEAMANDPQNPKVKEAYAELIKQTKAQYQALVDAGYKFWFIDLNNPENIDYISSPYNAMRDLRQNKQMGVFPTEEGFGSNEDVDVSQNPLLEDTGIMWAVGGLDGEMKPVTANDLFRAVHDAFGHGLEGAGFRARGEENAFQAHSRLYTGSAIGAMASETRGQNSWVNFGPFGEQNRTASAEDTVFADQKVGLMPEFTWTEGLAPDMQTETEAEAEESVPEMVPAVEEVFQSNPKLSEIGTIEQYLAYINSIFPNSKIKDVLYRGLNPLFETTTLFKEGSNEKGDGIYFTTNKEFALRYGNELTTAIVNIENPKTTEYDSSKLYDRDEATRMEAIDSYQKNVGFQKKEDNSGFDGIEGRDTKGTNDEIAVFDKSQIHLLGTEEDVQGFKDFVESTSTETAPEEFGTQGLSEAELSGYDRMMGEVEGIVQKSKRRGVSEAKTADNVMSYVMGSKVYENATDVQREALVRDIRKRFGLREKAAPSVARLFGKIKDVKKITMTEKVALKKQIRDLARGARDAVRAFRLASQQLSKDVKELKQSGKITADQAANIIRAFSKVNVFSAKSVDRFTTYMTKVFENADYAAKIKDAKGFRSSLKKLSKNKDKNANLRVAAAQFVKIDPALVEDIETYNEIAAKLKEAITGSSVRGQKVRFAETTNIKEATDYISTTLKEQEQKIREERIAELQDLMGVDASEFSAEEMLALLEPEAKTNKYNEGIVRATIKRAFDVYSAVIKDSISTGKDIFTDEDVEYTKAQKELIKKFMNMDTDKMNVKDSLAAVDSLMNFLTNQSTAKMEAVVSKYTGQQNAAKIKRDGISAIPLRKLWLKGVGRFLGEQTTNLNILFEKMFVGFNRSGKVRDAMGLTDLVNGKANAQRQTNNIVSNYIAEFYNKKANNQKFNTLFNNVERGMAAFVSRNIIGTEAEMQEEFDRRKKLIEESIEVLSIGNDQERKKALVYQEVYDKVLDGSTNVSELQSKVDPTNLEAVDFWIKEWDSKFDELSDTALNIYNKVLDKDLNYTPDRFTRMSYDGGSVDLANTASAFITNTNGNLYKKETGVLMEATRPEELPKNADSNEAESYIDLSFDKNNSNSMYDALVDINTAAPIRQVEAFMNTADFRKIFGEDADLIKGTKSSVGRVQQYINNIRNKNPYSNDEFAKAMRGLNKIATLGVSQALAGPTQPLKQVVPVVFNTLINAKGNIDFTAMSNKDFMSWLNESGYAISNRGVESLADIDSINQLVQQAAESKGAKFVKLIEDANKKWLKLFLTKPDAWVAISSWKSYYEKSLRDKGIDTKGIDYSAHEINKDAADYAQRMVDRQQNVSDTDMAGALFSDRNPKSQLMMKIFMPFASFRMNQGSRLGSDLRVLSNWDVSTAEDKKIAARSLAGYAVEMAIFRTVSAGIAISLASLAASIMGKGDDEEEKEKRREAIAKGAVTSTVTDIFSPLPVIDKFVQDNGAFIFESVQKGFGIDDKDVKNIYNSKKVDFISSLGTLGIAANRIDEIWNLISLSATGEYKDDFGKTKQISEENRQALTQMIAPVLVANVTGLAGPETATVGRNVVRIAKKKGATPEEIQEMREQVELIQKMVDEATSPEEVESAEAMLDRVQNPKRYEGEKEELKAMKEKLLIDEETGTVYENLTDLKRYNPDLYEKNFGKGSEYYELSKSKKELDKMFKAKEREIKDEEFGYVPKKKKRKNSDGTYKKYSSSSRSSSASGSQSSSNSKYEYYDSRGIKTTVTSKSNRSSKYD